MRFEKLLVANRGEIATRIIRAARSRGLRTVAVYSDADRGATHVVEADESVWIGPTPARESYLRVDRILGAAKATGAGAIHPGYGMLSEDSDAAARIEQAGLVFVGPTVAQLARLGAKDEARRIAAAAGLPLLPGTEALATLAGALQAAEAIGYPVMLKATGGGGGMGLTSCASPEELAGAWERTTPLLTAGLVGDSMYVERYVSPARHIEVQVFGDGAGRVITLGDRDCTLQRRHQKVIEEAPAPDLPAEVRARITDGARRLAELMAYRSAGTVEFVYDIARGEAYFLEVNPRLQVEHTITEEIHGIDLVDWMLRLAQGDAAMFDAPAPAQHGHAIQMRVYAETAAGVASGGLLTGITVPSGPGIRVDGWVAAGQEVTPGYDPLLFKVIVTGGNREEARAQAEAAIDATRVLGVETNLGRLRAAVRSSAFAQVEHTTATMADVIDLSRRCEVLRAGRETTVQEWPGRLGLWNVGVPPSGPMDDRSFRYGNAVVGNPVGTAGLECLHEGPRLRFPQPTTVCVTGAPTLVTVNGDAVPQWEPIAVPAGGILDVGAAADTGLRQYVLIAGGIDVAPYLGSRATFTLGRFGGHGGRPLRSDDVLALGDPGASGPVTERPPVPAMGHRWEISVTEGPHAAPEFLTEASIEAFYAQDWEVHFNSARTGIRLVGPRPEWARSDGGEAGLHPSNIHDTPYAVGAVDFTGDVPIVLGPDGPSLGGFVCPATVVRDERWKLGQLRPGDTVRFHPVSDGAGAPRRRLRPGTAALDHGVLGHATSAAGTAVTFRRSGDDNLLIEFGPMEIDVAVRLEIHALAGAIAAENLAGIVDITPGIRSLQIAFDPDRRALAVLLDATRNALEGLPDPRTMIVDSRTVSLPLSWDDPAARLAVERYSSGVRPDAPWCPSNIEFIRRVNGLERINDVQRIVLEGEYLVMGLGDVYLGAPVTIPLDPRHRLVTTKYNPARTWTPENAVGIGGAYLAIYGMEGPGGYQLIGRTIQVWNAYARGPAFPDETPWMLRMFDRLSWFLVTPEELLERRADIAAGRGEVQIEAGRFDAAAYGRFLDEQAEDIAAFRRRQQAAFAAERASWASAGEFDRPESEPAGPASRSVGELPAGTVVAAPLPASVWRVHVAVGDEVRAGDLLVTLEAMKMETGIEAGHDGRIAAVLVEPGATVGSGSALAVLTPTP